MKQTECASALCHVGRLFGERQWCLATSGNFSARLDGERFLITASGREKSALTPDDLMTCDLDGGALDAGRQPSAETPLHALLYRLDPEIGSVLHTHSVAATVLSRAAKDKLSVSGFEMQKAFDGIATHAGTLPVHVFDNDQDMAALATRVEDTWHGDSYRVPGFLIRGHGLYAWGSDIHTARRHVEGFEFLFSCLLHERATAR